MSKILVLIILSLTFSSATESSSENKVLETEGYYQDFELKLKNGLLKKWIIPSGSSFWSITKKCEFIGRKYITPYQE